MNDSGFRLLIMIILTLFLLFYEGFKRIKAEKKNKELKADNDNLLKQIEILTHENNVLKKRGADMI